MGVATTVPSFVGFPLGVTSGTFDSTLSLIEASSFNPAFVTSAGGLAGAAAMLATGITNGTAYLNIHTSTFPGGEIRGFLTPAVVAIPEPETYLLLLAGLGLIGTAREAAPPSLLTASRPSARPRAAGSARGWRCHDDGR